MAEIEVPKVSRVYIKDPKLARTSMHHTVYAGAGPIEPGKPQALITVEFQGGISRNMDPQVFRRLKELGHVTEERPKSRWEEAEEAEDRREQQGR
jgi:hypothetical protein